MKTNVEDKIDVSLICCPPTRIYAPLAGITAIRSYLEQHAISSEITYFNIEISRHGLFQNLSPDTKINLMPYIYLYNKLITKDEQQMEVIKTYLMGFHCQELLLNTGLADELFEEYILETYQQIEITVERILDRNPRLIGFTSKFYQWIPASVFAYLFKKKRPDIPLLIGGWSIKDGARAILQITGLFDFACWGEGEIPVLDLYREIIGKRNIGQIPRIAYRQGNEVIATTNGEVDSFVMMDSLPYFNFDDYCNTFQGEEPTFPIERIRGCNWNRCRFCFLSQGYLYRMKSNERLIEEILYYIHRYKVYHFQVMDNDFIGKDLNLFTDLLFRLKAVREQYPAFKIVMAEIITKSLDRKIIEAIAEAGFLNVQIGLEALSQRLLNKMRKHQKLSENIFFIRETIRCRFMVNGLNVIIGTPGEETEDILENIRNLAFFRFFLNCSYIKLLVVNLAVANYSSYLRDIRNAGQESTYEQDDLDNLIPYPPEVDRFSLFSYEKNGHPHMLWNTFKELITFYKEGRFTYKFSIKPSEIIYKEYSGRKLVNEISFENGPALHILSVLQDKVYTFQDLCKQMPDTTPEAIRTVLSDLYQDSLVYYSGDFEDITTVLCLPEEVEKWLSGPLR